MKKNKTIMCMTIVCAMIMQILSGNISYAEEGSGIKNKYDDLFVAQNTIEANSQDFESVAAHEENEIKAKLDAYFSLREMDFLPLRSGCSNRRHADFIDNWSSELELTIRDADIAYTVSEILSDNEESLLLRVYEWVNLEYTCNNIKNAPIEEMGFGTFHILQLRKEDKEILNDSYFEVTRYEQYLPEYYSYLKTDETESHVTTGVLSLGPESNDFQHETRSAYSPSAAVTYAHTWCGQSVAGTLSPQNPANYNPHYYFYESANNPQDCCNFVSQCIYAGGLTEYGSWYSERCPDNTVPSADSLYQHSGVSWRYVPSFKDYWIDREYRCVRVTNASQCVAGNPLFWLKSDGYSTNHNMIIVGKNAGGKVLIDGHNHDAYKYPVDLSSKVFYTIDFVHNYSITAYPKYHRYNCSICAHSYNEPHSWVSYGSYYRCADCGLKSSSAIYPNKYSNENTK